MVKALSKCDGKVRKKVRKKREKAKKSGSKEEKSAQKGNLKEKKVVEPECLETVATKALRH